MRFGGKALRLAAALVGTALLGSALAGCGGNNATSDEIRIGANFEMTGNTANYGASTLEGLKLAIKEANDAGGINGKKITLVEADNKSEAAESVNAATKLISDDHARRRRQMSSLSRRSRRTTRSRSLHRMRRRSMSPSRTAK